MEGDDKLNAPAMSHLGPETSVRLFANVNFGRLISLPRRNASSTERAQLSTDLIRLAPTGKTLRRTLFHRDVDYSAACAVGAASIALK